MNYPHLSLFVKRVTHSQSQEIIPEEQVYHYKNNPLTTMPVTLVEALQEFLISIAIVVLIQKRTKFLSMMIHIDGIRKSNEKFAKWSSERIQNWFELLTAPDKDPGKSMTINSFRKPYNNIVKYMSDAPSFEDVMSKMEKAIIYTEVHLVQGDSETTIEWKANKGHILVGADMLNRGFTIEFSRLSRTALSEGNIWLYRGYTMLLTQLHTQKALFMEKFSASAPGVL